MITSRAAQVSLRKYLATDEILHKEIEEKIGPLPGFEDLEPENNDYKQEDDSDIPSSCVIKDAIGMDTSDADGNEFCIGEDHVAGSRDSESIFLRATGLAEDVWADADDLAASDDGVDM